MKHIVKEGACWVIGSGSAIKASDIPDTFPGKDLLYPQPLISIMQRPGVIPFTISSNASLISYKL